MTKVIAFANQKGGVAKTTSAVALAQSLAMEGKRILFLDLDPQENASNTLRVNNTPTLYDLMKARKPDDETLNKSLFQVESSKNITAIRGDIRLASADMEFSFTGREFIVRDLLKRCSEPYDVVIMDTPPTLGILTINALTAADTVVIPVSPDGYSLQGFMQLVDSVRTVQEYSNPKLKIGGILITRYAPQTNIGKQIRVIASELAEAVNTKVYQSAIRQTVAVNESIGKQLVPFGRAMKDFSDVVSGLKADVIQNSVTAGQTLLELANTVPNTGGVVSWFTGDNDLETFGKQLVPFGTAMKNYSLAVTGLNASVVTNSANAAKALVELSNNLPNSGGIVSWFTGDNDIASFGEQLVSFGQSFAAYYNSVSGVEVAKLSGVVVEFRNLVDLANGIKSVDTSGMSTFAQNLTNLGNVGIDGFINAFTNANSRVSTSANTMITAFINAIKAQQGNLTSTFTTMINDIVTAFTSKHSQFTIMGQTMMTNFISGIRTGDASARSAFVTIVSGCLTAIRNKFYEFKTVGQTTMTNLIAGIRTKDQLAKEAFVQIIDSCLTAIRNKYTDFYNAGKYLVEGFAKGIDEYPWYAEKRAREMARAAAQAVEAELDINSPSKVGYRIGGFFGMGFVNSLIDYADKSYNAGASVAKSAKEGLRNAVSKIGDFIENGLDSQPTIRPLLDLSDVTEGAGRLSALLSRNQAMKISTGMEREGGSVVQNGGTTPTSGNNYNFTQNNYSPKALSRIDIYRQTKNQFSALKGLVET